MLKRYQKSNPLRASGFVLFFIVLVFPGLLSISYAENQRITPNDFKYKGAFRLPAGSGESGWGYSGNALTYSQNGDRSDPDDGFPGSLFATGNNTHLFVSEISIPVPKISFAKNIKELNTARTIQPFTPVFNRVAPYLEQPRAGLSYLPGRDKDMKSKLYFSIGLHLQNTGFEPSHGWIAPDLFDSTNGGPWIFGNYTGYVTNDYLCRIPLSWANAHVQDQILGTGRGREGPWAGGGPAFFTFTPPKTPAAMKHGTQLLAVTPLLLYGEQISGTPEISGQKDRQMKGYSESDRFRGATWLTRNNKSALVFTCTKAVGKSWYGFANGTPWDYQCGQKGFAACPKVPEFPYSDRGFWAEDFKPVLLFYDTNELAQVAEGEKKSWEPQPYHVFDLSPYFFEPDYTRQDLINYKRDFVGAACFDEKNQLLYIMEPLADDDGKSIIHVFKLI